MAIDSGSVSDLTGPPRRPGSPLQNIAYFLPPPYVQKSRPTKAVVRTLYVVQMASCSSSAAAAPIVLDAEDDLLDALLEEEDVALGLGVPSTSQHGGQTAHEPGGQERDLGDEGLGQQVHRQCGRATRVEHGPRLEVALDVPPPPSPSACA